jgi:hypothetical protein
VSSEEVLSGIQETQKKLDDILAAGQAQVKEHSEMVSALRDIRERLDRAGPLLLPRPGNRIPHSPKRKVIS